jgi:hypothetical protein
MSIDCPDGTKDEGTFQYGGLGFGKSAIDAHQMAKSQCDAQVKAAADQFAQLEQCLPPAIGTARPCSPVGSFSIVSSKEFGPVEVASGFWIDGLLIDYDIMVTCVRKKKAEKKFR